MPVNLVCIQGNLTRDPELSYTPKGTALCKFSIAHNEQWGEKKEVHYFDVDVWGKTAENVAKFKKKGDAVIVEGTLKQDRWDDKTTGAKRSRVKIVAFKVHFLGGGKREGQGEDGAPGAASAPQQGEDFASF